MRLRLTRGQWLGLGIVGVLVAFAVSLAVTATGDGGGDDGRSVTLQNGTANAAGIAESVPAVPASEEYSTDGEVRSALGEDDGDASLAPPGDPQLGVDLQGVLDRKIIQSSSVDLGMEEGEVGRGFQEIMRIAETAGGFVASSSFTTLEDGQAADVTIRVPGDRYQQVLAQIRTLGTVTHESADASDVTEEYTDLEARLTTLQATERRYLELLARADTIEDILLVQDRLDGVRGQIEQVQGRITLLEHLTDLGTITVHLRPAGDAIALTTDTGGGGPDPLAAASESWEASLEALAGIAAAALIVIFFSWWLVPPFVLAAIAARWWLARRPRRAVETPAV